MKTRAQTMHVSFFERECINIVVYIYPDGDERTKHTSKARVYWQDSLVQYLGLSVCSRASGVQGNLGSRVRHVLELLVRVLKFRLAYKENLFNIIL